MKKALLLFFGVGILSITCAQQTHLSVVAPAGNADEANGVFIEWTLGELAIQSLQTHDGIFTQGFHQPILSVDQRTNRIDQLAMQVSPNPVTSGLFIKISAEQSGQALLTLNNLDGRLLKKETIDFFPCDIEWDMTGYPAGIYLLTLRDEKGVIMNSFKIVKNH